jgi:hypothetical protein
MKRISKRAVVCLVTGASAVGALGFGAVGTGATTSLAGNVGVHTDHSEACVYENGFQLFGRPIRATGYPGICAKTRR